MVVHSRSHRFPLEPYRVGPLAPYVDPFVARLFADQYGTDTAKHKCRVVADLSLWLERRRHGVDSLDEHAVTRFVRQRRHRAAHGDDAALRLLLDLLRESGVLARPQPHKLDGPFHQIEQSFEQYLMQERRLSRASLLNTLPYVRRFLVERFDAGPLELAALRPSDVTGFALRHAHAQSPGRAKLMVGALRSFFRFLQLRGEIATDLAGAVPTVPDWRMSTLPKSIEPEQVRRVLQSCDRTTARGRRDYAILLLLAHLGLRASEVAGLTLEDIDWEAGEITVRGKGPRCDRVPLPQEVGRAIVAYLRRGRPACTTRRVFLAVRAPIRELTGRGAVGCIVRRALKRAGLDSPRKGAHLLRHSLAVQMMRGGASLAEIGELLRHRRPDTTAIYAKVDLDALRALALPWPGGER